MGRARIPFAEFIGMSSSLWMSAVALGGLYRLPPASFLPPSLLTERGHSMQSMNNSPSSP